MTTPIEIYEIADWMASVIKNHSFGLTFSLERSYADWDDLLKEMDVVKVDVVPVGFLATEIDTRGAITDKNAIDVGVRKHFNLANQQTTSGRIDISQIDALVKFVRQLKKYLIAKRASDDSEAFCGEMKVNVTFDRKMLREHQQFLAIIRFTFDVYDEL